MFDKSKGLLISLISGLLVLSSGAHSAGINCELKAIELLSVSDQLESYSVCQRLMDKRVNYLNSSNALKNAGKDKEINLSSELPSPNIPGNIRMNPNTTTSTDTLPSVVTRLTGVKGDLKAVLAWSDGQTMSAIKGASIAPEVIVESISSEGVILLDSRKSKSPPELVFIGFGSVNLTNQSGSQPMNYPRY